MLRFKLWFFAAVLVATASCAQTANYLQISHADLPLYPPIARALNLTGSVEIKVAVAKGAVTKATVKSITIDTVNGGPLNQRGKKKVGLLLATPSLANVKSWHFDPGASGKFSVTYVYRIRGGQTASPENPEVEFHLPVVKVTARPFKPTVLYGSAARPE